MHTSSTGSSEDTYVPPPEVESLGSPESYISHDEKDAHRSDFVAPLVRTKRRRSEDSDGSQRNIRGDCIVN